MSTVPVYNLQRLHTSNVDRSNKRKWLYSGKARSRRYPAETIIDTDYANDLALFCK